MQRTSAKGSTPRTSKRPRVDVIKNAHLEPSCHCTGTTTVAHSNQNVTYVIRESRPEMDPPPRGKFFKTSKSKDSPTKRNPVVCPWNGPGLSVHWSQSGGQPPHLPLLPCIGVKRSTRRQDPQSPFYFFFYSEEIPT